MDAALSWDEFRLVKAIADSRSLSGAAALLGLNPSTVFRRLGALEVEGCPIAYRRWGGGGRPTLVLVHGGGAHSRWWDHVAPLLSAWCSVVALDLSGHGDSGWRDRYSFALWAEEILSVAGASGQPTVVVGHSMGGLATIEAAASSSDQLAGAVIVDSPIHELSPEQAAGIMQNAFGPKRVYPSVEAALARFHPVPDQPDSLPYVIDHVARVSLAERDGGFEWKFDPRFTDRGPRPAPEALERISCRFALLRSEFGIVPPAMGRFMHDRLGGRGVVAEIPLAYHHAMLDQPLSLVAALRTLLGAWDHGQDGRGLSPA